MENQSPAQSNNLSIPVAIVIAGALIAGAVYFGTSKSSTTAVVNNQPQQVAQQPTGSLDQMRAILKDDHILGNPDAPVKIVEYSDMECPFCKRFQDTKKQIMDEYEKDGRVAWVYRHYPLGLFSKSQKAAEATECASELGGNDVFWKYLDRYYELTLSGDRTDIDIVLPQIAREVGLNATQFASCLASGRHAQAVEENKQDAIATGGRGTPWIIVVAENGKKFPLSGAQPYASVKQLIEIALQEK